MTDPSTLIHGISDTHLFQWGGLILQAIALWGLWRTTEYGYVFRKRR